MIRTKSNILLVPKTGFSSILYFEKIGEQRQDFANFKDEVGLYAYLVKMYVEINGELIDASRISDLYAPQQAVFKLSTWFQIFGNLTPNQVEAQKNNLFIQLIGSNSADWFGLTINDLEVVPQTELNNLKIQTPTN